MRTSQKGFTLVELIVVITILAILGTIAFISLQGYSQDAKNSKVISDLRTLSTAIEASLTNGNITIQGLVGSGTLAHTVIGSGVKFGSGITLVASGSSQNYDVGTINFVGLRQNGDDFVDSNNKEYIIGIAYSGSRAYYQMVGEIQLASGQYEAVTSGSYVQELPADVAGLVSAAPAATVTPIVRGASLGNLGLGAPTR